VRVFAIVADVVMGLILGLFVYVAAVRIWPAAAGVYTAAALMVASILVVVFRRPNGSLTRSEARRRAP
jgi:hypothetical protein